MITIAVQVRKRNGEPIEGKRIEKTFSDGSQAAQWYDSQPGHNIAHDQMLANKSHGLNENSALDIQ